MEVKKLEESINLDEAATSTLIALYSNRLPIAEKYYLQIAIDSLLQGKFVSSFTRSRIHELDKAFYGVGVGKVNATEILLPMLNRYFGDRWELEVITPEGSMRYGNKLAKNNILFVYFFTIPVPEEKFGKIILRIGRPK